MKFNVLIDNKEKTPWDFDGIEYIANANICHLNTGDYTIEGLEDILCIERKRSVAELAHNVMEKRFVKELERMSEFEYRFLILEFNFRHIEDYPIGSDIPKSKHKNIKVRGPFIMSFLAKIQVNYNIHVIPCGHRTYAEEVACNLMKTVYRKYYA